MGCSLMPRSCLTNGDWLSEYDRFDRSSTIGSVMTMKEKSSHWNA